MKHTHVRFHENLPILKLCVNRYDKVNNGIFAAFHCRHYKNDSGNMASLHHEDDILELAELLQTGTLTEDGLDMWGVVPVADRKFQVPLKCVDKLDYNEEFLVGMVTCHSLTIIDGKLSGDPLDLKVSGWMTLADRPV